MRGARMSLLGLLALLLAGSDAAQSGVGGWVPSTDRSDAAQSGSDAAAGTTAATPTTIEIVRPERTIVRDVDEALPLILSGSALLLVLAGLAVTMLHTGMVPRPGRTH